MIITRTLALGVIGAAAAIFMSTGYASAEVYKAPLIIGNSVPEALTDKPGDPEEGRKTAINRKQGNCLACHAISSQANQPFHGEVGPSLDGVSERYSAAELRLILVNSKKMFEGTIMPAFYKADGYNRISEKFAGKTILTAQQVEDVIAFLKTQ